MKYMGLLLVSGMLFAVGLVAFEEYDVPPNTIPPSHYKTVKILTTDTCLTKTVS